MVFFRCKEKLSEKLTVVSDHGKGGKAVAYVYYIIYFGCWNASFEGRFINKKARYEYGNV